MSNLDSASIHERLEFAQKQTLGPHHVFARVLEEEKNSTAAEQISRDLAQFTADLEQRVNAGEYPPEWQKQLKGLRGARLAEKVLRMQRLKLDQRMSVLQSRYRNYRKEYTLDFLSDSPRQVRKTIDYKPTDIGRGESRENTEMRVFNDEYSATLRPLDGQAILDPGVRGDPPLARISGSQHLSDAGTPPIEGWDASHIRMIDEAESSQGTFLRVAYASSEDLSAAATMVLDVLPARDYKVMAAHRFYQGRLVQAWRFSDYRRIDGDAWYPFKQDFAYGIQSKDQSAFSDLLRRGDLSFLDTVQVDGLETDRVASIAYEIDSVERRAAIAANEFDLVLPEGTLVIDTRFGADTRMGLTRDFLVSELAMTGRPGHLPSGVVLEEEFHEIRFREAHDVVDNSTEDLLHSDSAGLSTPVSLSDPPVAQNQPSGGAYVLGFVLFSVLAILTTILVFVRRRRLG